MELEVRGLTGAGYGERTADRLTQCNGYRDRAALRGDFGGRPWEPAAGDPPEPGHTGRGATRRRIAPAADAPCDPTSRAILPAGNTRYGPVSRKEAFFNSPRVHFMRNALAHARKNGRRVVSAFFATAFAQDHADAARAQWRQVADQVRVKLPKLAALLDDPAG
jgi:hypothetical protein